MDENDKILKDYVSSHNKKFNIYFIYCEYKIQFDNNYTRNLSTACVHNKDFEKIYQSLIYYVESIKINGYIFEKIYEMTINTISDKCNITHEIYFNNPMPMVERRINFTFAKNPQLINSLERNKSHPLIRKFSHIPFIN